MDKVWVEEVKEIVDSFNKRRDDVTNTFNKLQGEFKAAYSNIDFRTELVDKQNLIWRVKVDNFLFDISEKELRKYEEQTLEDFDENNNPILLKISVELKEAVQRSIIDKLKSF